MNKGLLNFKVVCILPSFKILKIFISNLPKYLFFK